MDDWLLAPAKVVRTDWSIAHDGNSDTRANVIGAYITFLENSRVHAERDAC